MLVIGSFRDTSRERGLHTWRGTVRVSSTSKRAIVFAIGRWLSGG